MLQKNCKILFLGDSFTETFFHIAEEKAKVPYRFWKTFKGNLIKNSVKNKIEIQYYARSLEIKPKPYFNIYIITKQTWHPLQTTTTTLLPPPLPTMVP